MVGRVTTVIQDPSSNFLTLNVKASTNFFNLEYVYLVENRRMEDQNKVNIKEAVNE
jgi:rod shape-determining protein MreC